MNNTRTASTRPDPAFWSGKRVLLTGQTGFKGAWAAMWLARMGAHVTGLGLLPKERSLYEMAGVATQIDSRIADIRDADAVEAVVAEAQPELVLHMAAQAFVRRSIREPDETWTTNVIGTGRLLGAVRAAAPEAAVLVITSDKVYANDNSGRAFREEDPMGGKDPYSASKAGCEILVASHRTSFFAPAGQSLVTARGGNVIGGGDFSEDRLIPDILRAIEADTSLSLRHPEATRPWQHVLDCLSGYLVYLQTVVREGTAAPVAINIGPDPEAETTVGEAADIMLSLLNGPEWRHEPVPGSIEALALRLDPALAADRLGWRPRLQGRAALEWTADWYAQWRAGADPRALAEAQIERYEAL